MTDLTALIKQKAKQYFPYLIEVRRHLHAHPEISFKEVETSRYISTQLIKHRIEHQTGVVNTGIVALIKGKNPNKRCLLLRADMDALPITEKNEVPYKSTNEGLMHACGHDVHSTCILGAAIILNELKGSFEGTIKIVFQPGEELLPGGASLMIKEGILLNPKVDAALALHVFSDLDAGQAGFRSGMYMASTDEIYITIIGKGGHAAMPAEYNNPILIASEVLLELSKEFPHPSPTLPEGEGVSPLRGDGRGVPTVLAFGKIVANGATNVIPDKVLIEGTFRTMNEAWRKQSHEKIKEIVNTIAKSKQAKAEVNIIRGYPFLVNDERVTTLAKDTAISCLGKENVVELPPRMTAEDFAFISQAVPSCFFRLGTGNKKKGITAGVHTATFNIDESAIEMGATLLAAMAVEFSSKPSL
ncbi:MAG: M20 metallopeptidase family protein [Bacteroidia bacterium]